MAETIRAHLEQADFTPGGSNTGDNSAPGGAPGGRVDPDPLGIYYINLGPLAYLLNEAVEGRVDRGADRDELLDDVAEQTGPDVTAHDAEAVLNGDELCPPQELLSAFATVLSLSADTLVDAAKRGGCTNYGPATLPPGY